MQNGLLLHKVLSTIATSLIAIGSVLLPLGIAFLTPIVDLFPLQIPAAWPLESGSARAAYYQVTLTPHAKWVDIALVGTGMLLVVIGKRLRRQYSEPST